MFLGQEPFLSIRYNEVFTYLTIGQFEYSSLHVCGEICTFMIFQEKKYMILFYKKVIHKYKNIVTNNIFATTTRKS